jgi:DNA polymerase-1
MLRLVFDVETNGYLHQATRCWLVSLRNFDTGEKTTYRENDFGWMEAMDAADVIIGHNILGFDLPVLYKLFKYRLPRHVRIHDTLIMSQVQNYRRFGDEGHSLAAWGDFLEVPKLEFDEFLVFSEAMVEYCERDVELNAMIYAYLLKELDWLYSRNPLIAHYLRAEMCVSEFSGNAGLRGWPFHKENGEALCAEMALKVARTTELLEQKLGRKSEIVDRAKNIAGVVEGETKKPKWVKNGNYHFHTAAWFNIDPETGSDPDRLIEGDYCRVAFPQLKLSSVADVKIFLFRLGWVPTEYNYKRNPVTFRMERTSPKITEDSLEFLGGDGKLYLDYRITSSRYSILKTWLESLVFERGQWVLKGDCFTIGTPSMRSRHKLIANVAGAEAAYGPEMRSLFIHTPGWTVVGCDSSGNQARGLAFYLNNPEFIDVILNGDVHTYNAEKLTDVLLEMGIMHTVPRSAAKRILYAFLFGASGGKLWGYLFGSVKVKQGNVLKKGFTAAVPGFKALLQALEKEYWATAAEGDAYIESLVGTRIYVDSPHKLLVYLLQALEKITCASALHYAIEKLREEGIPYHELIMYHDEFEIEVPDEYAERAREIGIEAFREAPKLYGIEIMDGDGKIGKSWYDVH